MKVKIGKYIWDIKYVNDLFNSFGNTTFSKLEININKNQSKVFLKDTIYHEIIHAYIKSYGFNKEYYHEEEMVTFITQNKEQFELLTNKVIKGLKNEKEKS